MTAGGIDANRWTCSSALGVSAAPVTARAWNVLTALTPSRSAIRAGAPERRVRRRRWSRRTPRRCHTLTCVCCWPRWSGPPVDDPRMSNARWQSSLRVVRVITARPTSITDGPCLGRGANHRAGPHAGSILHALEAPGGHSPAGHSPARSRTGYRGSNAGWRLMAGHQRSRLGDPIPGGPARSSSAPKVESSYSNRLTSAQSHVGLAWALIPSDPCTGVATPHQGPGRQAPSRTIRLDLRLQLNEHRRARRAPPGEGAFLRWEGQGTAVSAPESIDGTNHVDEPVVAGVQ